MDYSTILTQEQLCNLVNDLHLTICTELSRYANSREAYAEVDILRLTTAALHTAYLVNQESPKEIPILWSRSNKSDEELTAILNGLGLLANPNSLATPEMANMQWRRVANLVLGDLFCYFSGDCDWKEFATGYTKVLKLCNFPTMNNGSVTFRCVNLHTKQEVSIPYMPPKLLH